MCSTEKKEEEVITDFTDSTDEEKRGLGVKPRT
jgi:hypothetical protein